MSQKNILKNDNITKKHAMQRRHFLKKSVYAAPTLIAMGQLIKPQKAEAGFGSPPSDANGW